MTLGKNKIFNIPGMENWNYPLIVYSDYTSGIFEFLIKWRTFANYNHVMWATKPGTFVSQGNTYSEVKFERYMKKNNRLKFVELVNLTPVQRALLQASIAAKLARPWWKKGYDWLGIFGQAIGQNWINNPWIDYCSEDPGQHLKNMVAKGMNPDEEWYKVAMGIKKHLSPQELSDYCKPFKNCFKLLLKWEGDDIDDEDVDDSVD